MSDLHINLQQARCPECRAVLDGVTAHPIYCQWERSLMWVLARPSINWNKVRPSLGDLCPRCDYRGDKTRLFQSGWGPHVVYDCGRCGYSAQEIRPDSDYSHADMVRLRAALDKIKELK